MTRRMSTAAVFHPDGERFLPGPHASGPWGADRMHGGPVFGLMTRAVERAAPDPELIVSRLSFDLFRPVPVAPLAVRVEPLRQGSRLALLQASLEIEGEPYARATALLLRPSDGPTAEQSGAAPASPEGLPIESLMRGTPRLPNTAPGFHTMVETRWVERSASQPLTVWFRLPIALVEGETPTPLQTAVALSDFTNAIASIAARERSASAVPYINADATLYFARRPEGEWLCLQDAGSDAARGLGVSECTLSDTRGRLGRALQARLANRMR
jgi:acyl-CoA thioesterase